VSAQTVKQIVAAPSVEKIIPDFLKQIPFAYLNRLTIVPVESIVSSPPEQCIVPTIAIQDIGAIATI